MAAIALNTDVMPLLGAALGDALGSGVEGGQALGRAIAEDAGAVGRRFWPYSPFGFAPGEVTDDTQMALTCLAALRADRPDTSTTEGRLAYVERVGAAYRAWLRSGPPDVGVATRTALLQKSPAGGWEAWAGTDSAGNGSLMRATAPFCAGYRGARLIAAAALDSALTHPDPRCVAACIWYSSTLEAATRIGDPTRVAVAMRSALDVLRAVSIEGLLERLASSAPSAWKAFTSRWSGARDEVTEVVESALAGEHIDCIATPWPSWPTGFVIDTLQQATWAALQGDTADEALRLAVLHGGRDADTIAAIAGGLVGARFGVRALGHWSPHLLGRVTLGHGVPGVAQGPLFEALHVLFGGDDRGSLDWESLAYTIDGYAMWGSFEGCSEVALRVSRALEAGARPVEFTTDDLRTALFFSARAQRHAGHPGGGALEDGIVHAIVAREGIDWVRAEIRRARSASPLGSQSAP